MCKKNITALLPLEIRTRTNILYIDKTYTIKLSGSLNFLMELSGLPENHSYNGFRTSLSFVLFSIITDNRDSAKDT